MFPKSYRDSVAYVVLLGLATGCNDAPSPIDTEYAVAPELSAIPGIERIRDVPARSIEVPREPRAWDVSASALEEALADGDWHATVAFKAPSSARIAANSSGWAVRHAVMKETAEEGLRLLASHKVEVIRYNALIAGAHVVFPPGVAAELRDHDLIDYIEPQHWYPTPGGAWFRPAGLVQEEELQVMPIGVEVVRADEVWN